MRSHCSGVLLRPLLAKPIFILVSSGISRPKKLCLSPDFDSDILFRERSDIFLPVWERDNFRRISSEGWCNPSPPAVPFVSRLPSSVKNWIYATSQDCHSESGTSSNISKIGKQLDANRFRIQAFLWELIPRLAPERCFTRRVLGLSALPIYRISSVIGSRKA